MMDYMVVLYIEDLRELLEVLSQKIGLVAIILGVLHVGNVYVFRKIHQHERQLKERLDRAEQALQRPREQMQEEAR